MSRATRADRQAGDGQRCSRQQGGADYLEDLLEARDHEEKDVSKDKEAAAKTDAANKDKDKDKDKDGSGPERSSCQ
jgi:hypothetical protein